MENSSVVFADGVLTIMCYGELAYQGTPELTRDEDDETIPAWYEIYPPYNCILIQRALEAFDYEVFYVESQDSSVGFDYGVVAFAFPIVG